MTISLETMRSTRKRTARLLIAIAASALLASPASAAKASPDLIESHGFKIHTKLLTDRQQKTVLRSLEQQLDIVESANVPADVLAFFRTVPLIVDPDMLIEKGHGKYTDARGLWAVHLKPIALPADRPIVLHELLHAFHHQVLKQPTPPIGRAYEQALRLNVYPKSYRSAHFLDNGKEFFAVIGSIFLYGKKIDQPPYDCSITSGKQQEFIAYLTEIFGPHACK